MGTAPLSGTRVRPVLLLILIILASAANAEPPQLAFPAACTPDQDCWIVNYMDDDPSPDSARDFQCGAQTYEGHDGIDIAIRDWKTLQAGVDVLAAADGTVLRTRDGMEDRELSRDDLQKLLKENRACGNGVFVDHGDGWQTIYCHMKKGSIVVKPGNTVRTGQKLGQVGHTGYVEFPHMHLGVKHGRQAIDPFTGLGTRDGCGRMHAPLWRKDTAIGYELVSIYAAGFRGHEPDLEQIKQDASSPAILPRDATVLAFWAALYGVAAGDRIALEVRDPDGRMFARREITQDRTRARQFYFVGKRTDRAALNPGTYTGTVLITRKAEQGAPITRELQQRIEVK